MPPKGKPRGPPTDRDAARAAQEQAEAEAATTVKIAQWQQAETCVGVAGFEPLDSVDLWV